MNLYGRNPKRCVSSSEDNFLFFILHGLLPTLHYISQLEKEGRIFSSRSTEALVYSLWSLLPAFCNYPVDTARSFEGLTIALCNALREEGDLRGVICSSLQVCMSQINFFKFCYHNVLSSSFSFYFVVFRFLFNRTREFLRGTHLNLTVKLVLLNKELELIIQHRLQLII